MPGRSPRTRGKMLHLNSCCCGCSLQTGSLITSIWELFLAALVLGLGFWVQSMGDKETPNYHEEMDSLKLMGAILISIALVSGFFAVLLLIGTVKKVPSLLKAWSVFAIGWVVLSIVGVFLSFANGRPSNILSILAVLLKIYCILVVQSFHHDLASPSEPAQPPACTSVGFIPAKGDVV